MCYMSAFLNLHGLNADIYCNCAAQAQIFAAIAWLKRRYLKIIGYISAPNYKKIHSGGKRLCLLAA